VITTDTIPKPDNPMTKHQLSGHTQCQLALQATCTAACRPWCAPPWSGWSKTAPDPSHPT